MVGVETQTIRFYEQQGLLPPPSAGQRFTVSIPRSMVRGWPSSVAENPGPVTG
ncbi:MerR family DNA-binding transcriptional regulator [Halopseudomonas pachastrellae]|nr:MerR family DNA-binding transcriptional regulator [Halopseudomonas pachastrellae]